MKISIFVISIHLLIVILAFSLPTTKKIVTDKLIVKTVILHPPSKTVAAASPKPAAVKKIPTQKKTPKPAEPVKKGTPTRTQPKKEAIPAIPSHLLRELEETIAKMDVKREKSHAKPSSIQKNIPLQCENLTHETDYQEWLVLRLRESLNLPDFGDVKIQLVITKDGSVKQLKVLKAESEKNRLYLEKHLPQIKFPPLIGSSEKREATFILTFGNEL